MDLPRWLVGSAVPQPRWRRAALSICCSKRQTNSGQHACSSEFHVDSHQGWLLEAGLIPSKMAYPPKNVWVLKCIGCRYLFCYRPLNHRSQSALAQPWLQDQPCILEPQRAPGWRCARSCPDGEGIANNGHGWDSGRHRCGAAVLWQKRGHTATVYPVHINIDIQYKILYIIIHYYTILYNIIQYYTLLYTIVHYYTLLYTIIQYYTILYTIIQYYTLLYTIIQYYTISYNITQYDTIWCNIIQYHTIWCNIIQYHTIWYNIIQNYKILYNIIQYFTLWYTIIHYDTLLYTIIQYYVILYNIMQYYTIFFKK